MSLRKYVSSLAAFLVFASAGTTAVFAENSEGLMLELNKAETSQNSCIFTFLVSSKLDKDIDNLAYEFVIFDNGFRVDRMTVFDFRELKAGRLRVRQFQLANTPCDSLGRILINDVTACSGKDIDTKVCSDQLTTSNKTEIEFLN